MLIGTKADQNVKLNQEEKEKIKNFGMKYVSTSSLTNMNVKEIFEEIARDIYYDKQIENYVKQRNLRMMKTMQSSFNDEQIDNISKAPRKYGNFLNFLGKNDPQEEAKDSEMFDLEEFSECKVIQLSNFEEQQSQNINCALF